MASAEEGGLSKSARKRANQKARAAEAEEAAPAAAPLLKATPKQAAAKPKAKAEPAPAAQPKAEAKAKAKGKAKAAAPEAAAPKAEAKAKAKAKTAPTPAPEAAPKPTEAAKAKSKSKAKPKKEEPVQEQPKRKESGGMPLEIDDGMGGDWEVATGLNAKQQKRKDKQDALKAQEENITKAVEAAGGTKASMKQNVPGMAPVKAVLEKAKGKAEVKAAPVTAVPAVAIVTPAAVIAKEKEPEKPVEKDPNVTATVKVDSSRIGRIIGPKGANITLIKEKTGVKSIDTAGDLCTIVGLPDTVPLAEHAIRELMEKGYMSIAFEDFKEDGLQLHPSCFPQIIGERGAIIQVIKKEAKVEIDIPSTPKNSPAGKKFKVSIAGSAEGVEKAKEIINSIVLYSHHEVTHPGFTHQEMDVEEWKYRFLIGKGGSEMRHIQNNFKVKVNIPRETSATDKVVVIGEPADVERAVKYIEKQLAEAEQPKGREAPEKSEDTWGEEGPVEAWMQPYMYKRRQ